MAWTAWSLLNRPEQHEAAKAQSVALAAETDDIALFPLTMPITVGPGATAVAVTISASRPKTFDGFAGFLIGVTGAALALALVIWITYRSTDRIERLIGPVGSRTVTRLTAFLLLCIGVLILITGVEDVLEPLLQRH